MPGGWATARSSVAGARSARAALIAYVVAVVTAFAVLLAWSDRLWLITEDWTYFGHYQAALRRGDVGSFLFDQYRGHWIATTSLLHEIAYQLVGVRHYVPYLLPTFLSVCGISVVLRMLMRRAEVSPWLATAFASLALLPAVASEDVAKAWQFTFTGGVLLGLLQLWASDHDGPVDRRDAAAIGFGVLGVVTSGFGVFFTALVAVSLCLRRRFRAAVANVVPVAVVYLPWYLFSGRDWPSDERAKPDEAGHVLHLTWKILSRSFDELVRARGIGGIVVVLLVIGAVATRVPWQRRGVAPVVTLAAGAPLFVLFAGVESVPSLGLEPARYQHVALLLLLPLAALVCTRLVGRYAVLTAGLVVALAALVVFNAAALDDGIEGYRRVNDVLRPEVVAMAATPALAELPADAHLSEPLLANLDVATVRRMVRDGAVPSDGRVPPDLRFAVAVDLGVALTPAGQPDRRVEPAPVVGGTAPAVGADGCTTTTPSGATLELALEERARLPLLSSAGGALDVAVRDGAGRARAKSLAVPVGDSALRLDLRDVDVTLTFSGPSTTRVCGLSG